ncbi:hypothetical protein CPC16_001944 [Podila verticillata]|nr:hypothetical protein BGZ52_001732 [Haplosporangium bisporale]KAF9201686.1 hypothetical protein BGZ59_002564 [Podila verticillata]KAF9393463.1 hypothetical protein CPC16_001944 [Podila verticillata]KFH70279.1 hypothetical protein MVEG_03130 [Podila verticillata NRRL 6337]
MTRTRTGDYKDLTNPQRERRQSKGAISDARAIPKKLGAGAGNWGVPGSEQEQQDVTSSNMTSSTSPPENKISVIDADTFSRLQNGQAGTSSDGQTS